MGNTFQITAASDRVITRCWDCVAGQAEFVWKLKENVEALKTALAELKDLSIDVIRRVKIAEDQHQLKQLDQVRGWLLRTETLINGADALIEESPLQIKKLCIGGCCSMSPKSNLKFGKQIAKMFQDVADHKSKGVFDKVAEEVPTTLVTERPSEHTVGLESTFNKAWSSLEAENVGIIGLYGMGGVGKTTLMNKINNKFCEDPNRFDVVIWIVVSKGFYIGKVQDDIARRIRIIDGTWNHKTLDEKALGIFGVLKDKKFVLLLDDIWERVDLIKVGIPLPTQENGSKVVFTTRSIKVCGQMEAHKIPVQCLPEEKAWELFQEKVGGAQTFDSSPRIRQLAHEVAKECKGLPLALITIARAMAFKSTVEEWRYALEVLRRSSISVFQDMGEEVYPLLKFSYDSLPNDLFRKCLLYCSLFSEDHWIPKDKLIDLWIGEGFLDGLGNTSLARIQGHHIIGSLVHACLLEEANYWYIKMHDVIRDMSLWIACKCEGEKWRFFVEARFGLTEAPEVGNWGSIHRLSLMENKIENLVETPNCPHLQTLFLNNNKLKVINNDFFQFMSGLRVLDLSENESLHELLVGISKLVSLECLDLSNTRIRQLPLELKALEKLKCLRLEGSFDDYTIIPRQLISAFPKLQVLRIKGCYYSSNQDEEDNSEWLVEELKCLNSLDVLTITIRSAFALDRFMSTERLCSCFESIGLSLDSEQLNILSLANIKSLKSLDLTNCESLEEVKMEWAVDGEGEGRMIKAEPESHIQTSVIATQHCFQSLTGVYIYQCSKLRDITWLVLAPNLRFLIVKECGKMVEIINERKQSQVAELVETSSLFAKLENLFLHILPELKSIYWDALPFSCLKIINVNECPKLKRLPLNSNSAKENKIHIKGSEEWWKELQWEDESTLNAFLPYFKRLPMKLQRLRYT
ncbi:hypothetical protein REPUB_Repub08aG0007900 [Reevesia pubescens]